MTNNYFKPIMKTLDFGNDDKHYITKQFLIDIVFSDLTTKKRQKILEKAKKLNIWMMDNDIFEPITITYTTCNGHCNHYFSDQVYDFGDCYHNKVEVKREFLKLKIQNIPDKIKDTKHDFYWIHTRVLKSLIDLFIILISKPHSTIGFTDRTPIYLLPRHYHPLKWSVIK